MKKTIVAATIAGLIAVSSYGQGYLYINNLANTGVFNGSGGTVANPVYSSLVTSNGLIFTTDVAAQEGSNGGTAGSTLIGVDFSYALYGGSTAGSLSLISSFTGSQTVGDNANWGQLQGPGQATAVGTVAQSDVYLDLYVWEGTSFSTYAAAFAGNDYTGTSGVFFNPSASSSTSPIIPSLTGLSDINLSVVPEPTTMAMAALGGVSLLLLRRKK